MVLPWGAVAAEEQVIFECELSANQLLTEHAENSLKSSPSGKHGGRDGHLGEKIMKAKALIVAVLALAALLVVAALVLNQSGTADPVAGPAAAVTSAPGPSDAPGTPGQAARPSGQAPDARGSVKSSPDSANAPKGEKTGRDPAATATRPHWDPQPTEADAGLEVPEQTKATAFALPSSKEREPLLEKTPKTGVAQGKLTKGFPKDAVPLPRSTTVVGSSVETQGRLVILGVEGRSKASADAILEFYAGHFAKLDWLTTRTQPARGTTQLRGGFGQESLSVTVRELPTGMRSVTASAVLTAGD